MLKGVFKEVTVRPLLSIWLCRNYEELALGSLYQYRPLMNISSRTRDLNIALKTIMACRRLQKAWRALGLVARSLLGGKTRLSFFWSQHVREQAHLPQQGKHISWEEAHIFSFHLYITSPRSANQLPLHGLKEYSVIGHFPGLLYSSK